MRYLPVEPSKQPSFPSIEAANNHAREEQELRQDAICAKLSFVDYLVNWAFWNLSSEKFGPVGFLPATNARSTVSPRQIPKHLTESPRVALQSIARHAKCRAISYFRRMCRKRRPYRLPIYWDRAALLQRTPTRLRNVRSAPIVTISLTIWSTAP